MGDPATDLEIWLNWKSWQWGKDGREAEVPGHTDSSSWPGYGGWGGRRRREREKDVQSRPRAQMRDKLVSTGKNQWEGVGGGSQSSSSGIPNLFCVMNFFGILLKLLNLPQNCVLNKIVRNVKEANYVEIQLSKKCFNVCFLINALNHTSHTVCGEGSIYFFNPSCTNNFYKIDWKYEIKENLKYKHQFLLFDPKYIKIF